jgi:hypothetical protein
MKLIFRILLAILIVVVSLIAFICLCWLLGSAAHAIGLSLIGGTTFGYVTMEGILIICTLGFVGALGLIVAGITDDLK